MAFSDQFAGKAYNDPELLPMLVQYYRQPGAGFEQQMLAMFFENLTSARSMLHKFITDFHPLPEHVRHKLDVIANQLGIPYDALPPVTRDQSWRDRAVTAEEALRQIEDMAKQWRASLLLYSKGVPVEAENHQDAKVRDLSVGALQHAIIWSELLNKRRYLPGPGETQVVVFEGNTMTEIEKAVTDWLYKNGCPNGVPVLYHRGVILHLKMRGMMAEVTDWTVQADPNVEGRLLFRVLQSSPVIPSQSGSS
jgi:hypothetical protein